jgi:tetratricopeptide (TPR) repeat protein
VWIEGRCASYGQSTAFLPIVDALRRYYGIDDRDEEVEALAKIDAGVAALGGDLAWTIPFVRQLLSLPPGDESVTALDAATRRSQTFRALKALTLQAAQAAPLVIVIEDLHWMDAASEEFLGFLAEFVPATRALLVCSHRPGYRHPFGDRSYHARVAVQALSEDDMGAMASKLLGTGTVPPELRALIARKAEGNPLFVEEVTKSLFEEGVLRFEGDRIALTRSLDDVSVPDTIHDVLMSRIDRLGDEPKRAIQLAAVIGREFALRLLMRIAEQGGRVHAHVDELRALELIYEKAGHPEVAYMFKHALTHDVAYASILVQRRKALHRTIASAIEELYEDRLPEHYETLAYHFTLGEDWERALDYHQRAAEKARDAYANHAIIQHCQEALAIADRLGSAVPPSRRCRLEEMLGWANFYVSEYHAGAQAHERAAANADDVEVRALNLVRAGFCWVWGHQPARAKRLIDESLAIARAAGKAGAESVAAWTIGWLAAVYGDLERYRSEIAACVPLVARSGQDEALGLLRFNQGEEAEWSGDYVNALAYCDEAIAIGRRIRLPHLVIWPTWFRGKALCCLGRYGEAIAELQAAYDLCDRIGDRAWKTRLLNTLGWCFGEFGSHDRARWYNEQSSLIAQAMGDPETMANCGINLAGNALAAGDAERAREILDPIWKGEGRFADGFQRWRYLLHATDALARVALDARDPERALTLATQELEGARRQGLRKLEARALDATARALLALDRREDARGAGEEAVALAQRIAYPRLVWRGSSVLAEIARRQGRSSDATALVARRDAVVETLVATLPDGALAAALRRDSHERHDP